MALNIDYTQLRREIGRSVGYDRSPANWGADEIADVDDILKSGMRRFYFAHPWSFLQPTFFIDLVVDRKSYELPPDFGGMLSDFTYATGAAEKKIARVGEEKVRALYAMNNLSGDPQYYAVRPKRVQPGFATAYEVLFYPNPDTARPVSGRYSLEPAELSATNTFPLGGARFSQCILEACLAEAEKTIDDAEGVHAKLFAEALALAIQQDKEMSAVSADVWPQEDELVSGLTIDRLYIERMVGAKVGIGPHSGTWNSTQAHQVKSVWEAGLRSFYHPHYVEDSGNGKRVINLHAWSFLQPTAQLAVVSGTSAYSLPDGFSGMLSDFTFASGDTYGKIARVDEGKIRALQSNASASSGVPKYYAIRARQVTEGDRSTQEVVFYPAPNAAFTLTYRFEVEPPTLPNPTSVPLGGSRHAGTILEACLAAAEKSLGAEGMHCARFQELLAASVRKDKELLASQEDVWTVDEDQQDSLGVNKRYLQRLIGIQLEYGANPGAWNATQTAAVGVVLDSALRMVYHPPMLPGEKFVHEWSFLRPLATISTVADQSTYDLPPNFAMLDGPLMFAPGESAYSRPIRITSESAVRHRLIPENTGQPVNAAITVVEGGFYKLLLEPIPDQEYDITLRYKVNPSSLSSNVDAPLGGKEHAQLFVEASRAAAEVFAGSPGVHTVAFTDAIATSVQRDRQNFAPETLGVNLDQGGGGAGDYRDGLTYFITYNDVSY